MDEDIAAVAKLLATRQAAMDAAILRAPTPELRGRLQAAADAFRESAASFLAEVRTRSVAVDAALAAYQARPTPPAPPTPLPAPPASAMPETDPTVGELAARLAADDFRHFGNRIYPPG